MAAVALLAGPRAAWARDETVPTIPDALGFEIGSREATVEEIVRYLGAVAAASPRVLMRTLPTPSVHGRPLAYAIVSHPRNLARLSSIARRTRRLRKRPVGPAAAERAARRLPAFVNAFANVHGNEPSGADALLQILYDLASRTDEANERRLRRLVLVLFPSQNPDGRDESYRTNARGFDLNRDWFAKTQPETPEKVRLYSRYPPILGLDLHEQFLNSPDAFFFPPNADPIHHETSRSGLRSLNEVFSPAVAAAFESAGYSYEHYAGYDVFAPIYGDTVPEQAYGAAGMLFEMENENVYPEKFARMHLAAEAALDAAAANKRELLAAWAKQWRNARNEGRRGRLLPNVAQEPGNTALPLPDERIYGYAFEPRPHRADLLHLVDRLRGYDIELYVTESATRLARLREFGGDGFGAATLPAGSILLPAGQPMKRFVHALLEDDPHAPVNAFYDVAGWSNPALMNLSGGAIGEPLEPLFALRGDGGTPLRRVRRARDLQRRPRRAGAYAFELDSAQAQAGAFALLAAGTELTRAEGRVGGLAAGAAVAPGSARSALLDAARRYGLEPRPLARRPSDTTALRRPRVALIHDALSDTLQYYFARSSGFAEWLLRERFGLDVDLLLASDIDAGALERGGYDALVCPNGFQTVIPGGFPNVNLSPPAAGVTPVGLLAVQQFVAAGGTYIGYLQQGISLAQAAGIGGGVEVAAASGDYVVPGSPFAVEVLGGDAATLGLGKASYVFNVRDPVMSGGETMLLRYPDPVRSLGYAEGIDRLAGTVAASTAAIGSGRSYVMTFDPAYRGWVEATQRLVGNALLTPPTGEGRAAREVDPDLLTSAAGYERQIVIRVPAASARTLDRALSLAAKAPAGARVLDRGDGTVEVQATDPEPLSGHVAGWAQQTLGELRRRGVRPTLVVA